MKKLVSLVLVAGLALVALPGCKKSVKPKTSTNPAPQTESESKQQPVVEKPAPETLKLISRSEVKLSDKPPLLANGGFETWQPGEPAPKGFNVPVGTKSAIRKEMKDVADGVLAVSQTWQALDNADSFVKKFGANVEGLKPRGKYVLEVTAKNTSNKTVTVAAWQDTGSPANPYERIEGASVDIPPFVKEFKTFSCPLAPNTDRPVRIFTGCSDKRGEFPATVIWDNWTITEEE